VAINHKCLYVKFNYDRLRIDKPLGNFRKSDDNNNKNKNNVQSAWGHFLQGSHENINNSDI